MPADTENYEYITIDPGALWNIYLDGKSTDIAVEGDSEDAALDYARRLFGAEPTLSVSKAPRIDFDAGIVEDTEAQC